MISAIGPASANDVAAAQHYLDSIVVQHGTGLRVETRVVVAADIPSAILRVADAEEVDLITMATRGQGMMARTLGGSVFTKPAYFGGTIYYGASGDAIKAFPITAARVSTTPASRTTRTFTYPGATPTISAIGTANAILWAVENNSTAAVLHAYDANDLTHELYNSNQAGSRDNFGPGNKFITPTIANGKVFVGTPTAVAVFGPLP